MLVIMHLNLIVFIYLYVLRESYENKYIYNIKKSKLSFHVFIKWYEVDINER